MTSSDEFTISVMSTSAMVINSSISSILVMESQTLANRTNTVTAKWIFTFRWVRSA
jgi:hypothetical protein